MATVGRQWVIRFGLMAVFAGGLTACGGEQASAPVTSLPAPTMSVPETVASAPAATARGGAEVPEGTPTRGTPASGTPAAGATPVAGLTSDRLAVDCAAYAAWLSNPDVKAALDQATLWPAVIAEGEKAAAGEAVDTVTMKQDSEQMAKLGRQLIASNGGEGDQAPPQLARRALGLTSRLANDLSDDSLDAKAAATAVAEAKAAIAAYEEGAAARQTACGQSDD